MTRSLAANVVRTAAAILGRALVLVAFSEFVFLNEIPVSGLIRAENPASGLLYVISLTALYMLPGALLFALEPRMRDWATCVLAGALVGWSIEGALVPAMYEAPPVSYFWTSVSWHAPVDVAFGAAAMPYLMSRAPRPSGLAYVALAALFWGLWSSWTWPQMQLSVTEFAMLAAIVTAILGAGYGLIFMTRRETRCGTGLRRGIVALTVAAALLWATSAIVPALLVAPIVAITAVALVLAPRAADRVAPPPAVGISMVVYLGAFAGVAVAAYAAVARYGAPLNGQDMAALVALAGAWFWAAALVSTMWRKRRARQRARAADT